MGHDGARVGVALIITALCPPFPRVLNPRPYTLTPKAREGRGGRLSRPTYWWVLGGWVGCRGGIMPMEGREGGVLIRY